MQSVHGDDTAHQNMAWRNGTTRRLQRGRTLQTYGLHLLVLGLLWGLVWSGIFERLLTPAYAQAPISLVTGEYPPYTGQKLPGGGLSVILIKAVFKAAGLAEPTLDWQPWQRGYTAAKIGRYHATFPYARDPVWEQDFLYSDPLHTYRRAFFTRHNFRKGVDGRWDELKLCLPHGWTMSYFDTVLHTFDITMIRPPSMEICLRMVERGRADLVADDVLVLKHHMKELFGVDDALAETPHAAEDGLHLFVLIPRDSVRGEEIRTKFNRGLAALRANGEYDRLVAQYTKDHL